MPKLRDRRTGGYAWPGAVIALLICALTVSLATRFCVPVSSDAHISKSVERRSVDPKPQHINRAAIRWVASVTTVAPLDPVTLYSHAAAAEHPLPSHVFDQSLYNRPPPELFL
jgi:hypothetical protein